MPQQTSHSTTTPPLLEIDFKDEFVEELVDSFYKSLRRCLPTILKSTQTSFASWRPILSRAIKSIRDVGGVTKAASLEELINNLEKYIGEWSSLNQLDLTPLVEDESERLSEQIKKKYLETSLQEAEVISQELKTSDAWEVEVLEAIVVSSEALDAAKNQIKKAEEMITRANTILSKAEPVRQAEIIWLEEMAAESIQIQHSGAKKRTGLAEIKSRLEKMAAFHREELKPQTILKAEEEKRNKLSALEVKIKSYERQFW